MTRHADREPLPPTSGDGETGISAGRFRALLANVADMVTISDRDGAILYASPATEKVSGYTPEEFLVSHPFDAIHPEDQATCLEALKRLSETPGLSLDLEHRVRHRDGSWRWVEGTFTSLFDDPEVGGLLATIRDITDRKRAEESSRLAAEADAFRVELADVLRPLTDHGEIQEQATRVLGEHLGANRVMYADIEGDGGSTVAVVEQCYAAGVPPLTGRFEMADFGLAMSSSPRPGPAVVKDVTSDPALADDEKARYSGSDIGAWVGVPLIKAGRFVAALGVHQSASRDWTTHEVSLVEETAERTWAAVERARAEERLRESEVKFRTLFTSIDEAFALCRIVVDSNGRPKDYLLLDVNPAFEEMTGITPQAAEGKTARDLVPGIEEWWIETYGRVALEGESIRFENRVEEMDRWFDAYASPVGEAGNGLFAIVFKDVTERKRADARLRESEERFRAFVTASSDVVYSMSADWTEMRYLGGKAFIADTENPSRTWTERYIHPGDREYVLAIIREAISAKDTFELEHRIIRVDGSLGWTLSRAIPLLDADGEITGWFGTARDVTKDKRTKKETERLKTREAAMRAETAERERISRELHDRVAHTMGVVYQNLQLHDALAETAPERAREKLAVAEDNARSALDQTRSLAMELRRSLADETENGLAEALRTLVETSTPDGVVAELSLSGEESLVPRDVGTQVYLVMREAIRNALKHSGGGFSARLEIQPDLLLGSVTDDGDGFEPEAAINNGRGIGLRSMRERAEMVGGKLQIISHPGDGTTIQIVVPLKSRP